MKSYRQSASTQHPHLETGGRSFIPTRKRLAFLCAVMLLILGSAQVAEAQKGDGPAIVHHDFGPFFGRVDYLLWQPTGMKLPPLVTGNPLGTPVAEAGVIGVDSTQILLGNEWILDDPQSGLRLGGGMWLCDALAIEAEFFWLFDNVQNYRFDDSLNQILGRSFINLGPQVPPIRYDTQLFIFPPFTTGFVEVHASSEFKGSAERLRFNLFQLASCGCAGVCDGGCGSKGGKGGGVSTTITVDLTFGHRYLDLRDHLRIDEQLITAGDQFDVFDDFRTSNTFHGLELGLGVGICHCNYTLDVFGRLAAGPTYKEVHINGETRETANGTTTTRQGGILAQASNIGATSANVASLVSELGVNAGVQLTDCLSANVGYSVLYWGSVARAGQQIDMNVHPDLFPQAVSVPGTIGAQRRHSVSDFVAHGLNVGLTFTY